MRPTGRPSRLPGPAPVRARVVVPLLLVGSALGLAGCGGDPAAGPTPGPSSASTTSPATDAPGSESSTPQPTQQPTGRLTTAPTAPPRTIASVAPATPVAPSRSAPSRSAARRVAGYCGGLASSQLVGDVAGVRMARVSVQAVDGTPGCRWDAAGRSGVRVEVVNASSSTWAKRLPEITAALRSSGVTFDDRLTSDLATARRSLDRHQEVDADLACTIFGEIAVATGSPTGADATVRVDPATGSPTSISAQVCNADEYSFAAVVGVVPGTPAPVRVRAVEYLLQRVQGAPFHL